MCKPEPAVEGGKVCVKAAVYVQRPLYEQASVCNSTRALARIYIHVCGDSHVIDSIQDSIQDNCVNEW